MANWRRDKALPRASGWGGGRAGFFARRGLSPVGKPVVFISHSTRPERAASPPDGDADPVAAAPSAAAPPGAAVEDDVRAREVLCAVVEGLKTQGWDVWWDARLEPGVQWREEIFRQLRSCQAGVVLVTRRSADRPWVQAECSVMLQWAVRVPHYKFVPIMLDSPDAVASFLQRLEPWRVKEWQALAARDADPKTIVALLQTALPAPKVAELAESVCITHLRGRLESTAPAIMDAMAGELKLPRLPRTREELALDVASALYFSPVDQTLGALRSWFEFLRPTPESLRGAIDSVGSLWLPVEHVTELLRLLTGQREPAIPVVRLALENELSAFEPAQVIESYDRRISKELLPSLWKCVPVDDVPADPELESSAVDPATVHRDFVAHLESRVLAAYRCSSAKQLGAALARARRQQKGRVFVITPSLVGAARELAGRHGGLQFMVVARTSAAPAGQLALEPALNEEHYENWYELNREPLERAGVA